MYGFHFFLLLSAMLVVYSRPVDAVESGFSKAHVEGSAVPTTITSNKMTVRNHENQAIFEGNVILTRGSLTVNSEKMIVYFQEKNGGSSGTGKSPEGNAPKGGGSAPSTSGRSLERVEALGHVQIKQDNSRATCQKAVYFSNEDKIVMTGEPLAWEKGTRVSGKQITIYLAEERSVVEGDTHVHIEDEELATP